MPRLSKSRYTAGVQCHKLLWWKVHEPLAVELQPDKVLEDRFDRSEEHTSELQSPCNLVCRLLLEKKKKKDNLDTRTNFRSATYIRTSLVTIGGNKYTS